MPIVVSLISPFCTRRSLTCILLKDLGLPNYFFRHIDKESLVELLKAIASDIHMVNGRPVLRGQVAPIDFADSSGRQSVRIATGETRDSVELFIEKLISGRRREYYFSPESDYYTYIAQTRTTTPILLSPEPLPIIPRRSLPTTRSCSRVMPKMTQLPHPPGNGTNTSSSSQKTLRYR